MNITVSEIDGNGNQSISGMFEEAKFNKRGLWHNAKAFSIDINHKKQISTVCTFAWVDGVPANYTVVKTYKEIIDVSEDENILMDCNLIEKEKQNETY